MFADKVRIFVKAGNGGNGAVSFHTEKYVPNGGPDGGDGGKGGDVIFVASSSVNTLSEFYYKKHYRAQNGENGAGQNCYGKQGQDLKISVPVGTVVRDKETGRIMADMFENGQTFVVMRGGEGGRGNRKFATSRRQAPAFSQHGVKTEEKEIELELKTIADVGLVGFPNVGKSTLLSVISAARPKIANYHFTTLNPNLGVVDVFEDSFVVADIPGLIEGAGSGAGLGHEFLRHIERTRMLVHVLDMSGSEGRNPCEDFLQINRELEIYSKDLTKLKQIVVANKMDLPGAEENLGIFRSRFKDGYEVFPLSAVCRDGVKPLLTRIAQLLKEIPPVAPLEFEPFVYEREDSDAFEILANDDGSFEVVGPLVDSLARKVLLDDYDSLRYMQKTLKSKGVFAALKKAGMKDGDTVVIGGVEFDNVE